MPSGNRHLRQSESAFVAAVLALLRERGIVCWKTWGGGYNPSGLPDIIGVLPGGKTIAIECKKPGLYPNLKHSDACTFTGAGTRCTQCGTTALQKRKLTDLRNVGATAFVADNLDEVRRQLGDVSCTDSRPLLISGYSPR